MKKYIYLSLLLFISCTGIKNSTMDTASINPVIAHRGAFKKNGYPENSIAALKEAIRLKCVGSEFDVRMSADDSLVVNHDPDYKGMDIEHTAYQTLSKIPLSNGETLPTLRQYLQAGMVYNSQTKLVLEIKPSPGGKGRVLADRCVAMVRELGAAPNTVYISFDFDILKRIHEIEPKANLQYLNGDKSPEELKDAGINGADYHFSVFQKNPEWIERAKKAGVVLNAWTVNTEQDMRWLLSKGFNYITTNEPELLFDVLRSLNK